ncbi:hypothetical protein RhiirA1_482787 [Rhizophagus irregularis]|uniref:Uncharacterized protein n=1 Tax=Rhizophagus irregularis TaxID=588596 RepID=A0A2N0QLD7_9GLOM|nr:hypothetical protein RhiirA1_482787 [Rhizophagus irregularis]
MPVMNIAKSRGGGKSVGDTGYSAIIIPNDLPQHNNNLRAWERTHITTKNKKRVKRFTTSRSSNSTSNTVNLSPTLDSSSIPTAANSSALPRRHPFMSRVPNS